MVSRRPPTRQRWSNANARSGDGNAANSGANMGGIDDGAEQRGEAPIARRAAGGGGVVALLVWFTMGIALWHFTVFLPDRFWQGIVGAFLGSVIGAVVFGAIVEIASGKGLGDTDVSTALTAIPGVAIGLAVIYAIGVRAERAAD